MAFGDLERKEMVAMNSVIFDVMEYRPMKLSWDPSFFLEPEEMVCPHPATIESFAYSFRHLSELWYFYLFAVCAGTLFSAFSAVREFALKKRGEFIFNGIRGERNM